MFSKHLFKVIVGFCGVILLGLLSLVIISSFKNTDVPNAKADTQMPSNSNLNTQSSSNSPTPVSKSLN